MRTKRATGRLDHEREHLSSGAHVQMHFLSRAEAPPAATAPGLVRSIQYLRGVAALGVVVFHAADRAGGSFGVGAAGVDIFFVISGFIMWEVTCRRTPSPGAFLLRRAQRIVPLYWLITLGTAGLAIMAPAALPAMRPTLAHVGQSLLFIPHFAPDGLIAPLIVPGWTLSYEIFFYLIFAFALVAPARLRVWLVSAILAGCVLARPLGDAHSAVWTTFTDPILLEFGAGVWLGWARSSDWLPGRRTAALLIGIALVALAWTAISAVDVSQARVFLWGLPAALLVTGFVSLERHRGIPALPAMQLLGDASYSIYLIHGLAISAVGRILKESTALPAPATFAVALVAGVLAGLLLYACLERPLSAWFTRNAARPEAKALGGVRLG